MDMKYAIYAMCFAFSELILQGNLQETEFCEYLQIPYGSHPFFFKIKLTITQPAHIIFTFYLDFKSQSASEVLTVGNLKVFFNEEQNNMNIEKD